MKLKLPKFKLTKKIILFITLGLFLSLVIFLARETYLYDHPMERKSTSFKTYVPTKLPNKLYKKEAFVWIRNNEFPFLKSYEPQLHILLASDNPGVDSIYESRHIPAKPKSTDKITDQKIEDPESITTPDGQQYTLYSKYKIGSTADVSYQVANFVKNGTNISIYNDVFKGTRLWTKEELNNMIDSFVPYDPKRTRVEHVTSPI